MNKKPKKYTSKELQKFQLKDCSARAIYGHEVVEVFCFDCGKAYTNKLQNVKNAILYRTGHWFCRICTAKKARSKSTKLFGKGSKHSDKAKQKMRTSSAKRWESLSRHDKEEYVKPMIDAYKKKYGDKNPMSIENIRLKYDAKMEDFYNDDEKVEARSKKTKKTCIEKYGVETALLGEEVSEKRKDALKQHFDDPKKAKAGFDKAAKTCREKYGNQVFFKSEYFKELKANSDWSSSKGETEIKEWIESCGLECKKSHTGNYEIDIFLPEQNLGIEFHGLYWHSEACVSNSYHLDKLKDAAINNIKLIQIFEHEWNNRKKQVKSRLKSLLGLNQTLGARKCKIAPVDVSVAKSFVNENHIQGYASSSHRFGLWLEGSLVAIATFGLHHRNGKDVVLNRFCCKDGLTVQGALSRLTKHAHNFFKKPIISWCDLRWSDGSGYEAAGWKKDKTLRPDYFYFKGRKVFSKHSRTKKEAKTPEGMTEKEHALEDGLLRVYDCGKIRYIFS